MTSTRWRVLRCCGCTGGVRSRACVGTAGGPSAYIEEARQTLAQLEVDTWGIVLREIEGERVVVLAPGTLDNPRWTWRDRPAVKLSRE